MPAGARPDRDPPEPSRRRTCTRTAGCARQPSIAGELVPARRDRRRPCCRSSARSGHRASQRPIPSHGRPARAAQAAGTSHPAEPRRARSPSRSNAARSRRSGVTQSTASDRMLALALLCAAQLMVILDVTVVNVAMPSIRADLGFAFADLQWVVTAYTLAFGGLLLLGGRAADLLGRRRVFLSGLAIFTAASLASGLAASPEMLLGSRALQGAALLSPAALSLITAIFPEGLERNRALAAWAAVGASGAAFGVLLGGSLTEAFGWEAIFLVNVPVGIAVALAAVRALPAARPAAGGRMDAAGALIATASLV